MVPLLYTILITNTCQAILSFFYIHTRFITLKSQQFHNYVQCLITSIHPAKLPFFYMHVGLKGWIEELCVPGDCWVMGLISRWQNTLSHICPIFISQLVCPIFWHNVTSHIHPTCWSISLCLVEILKEFVFSSHQIFFSFMCSQAECFEVW